MDTPILFLIFNRPRQTEIVFQRIREIKPTKLYISADGPRASKPGELEICKEVRQIATKIDWECDVKTLFREKNLGCGLGVSSAIDWFFENEEEGIILEDDCLPDPSFFSYCTELLERYRHDDRVMHISGFNSNGKEEIQDSNYYFSMIMIVWGWATWRRAWQHYEYELNPLIPIRDFTKKYTKDWSQIQYWAYIYESMSGTNPKWDTWDFQWMLSIQKKLGLIIKPTKNLVSNIGYGLDATHTNEDHWLASVPAYSLDKLVHPTSIVRSKQNDTNTFYKQFPQKKQHPLKKNINKLRFFVSRFLKGYLR